ncbi:MAG: type I methionyl aminopeptidase [Bacteroidetes bacterium]|nr:type I methionyl aminopeptidase [Bacteroidota bacterium]
MARTKSARELDRMRESCRIVGEVLRLVGQQVRAGVTTGELDAAAEQFIRVRGGVPAFKGYGSADNPFPATLCTSVNEEVVHGIPGRRVLNDGDIVSIDVGVLKDGWYGDAAKTFAVGTVNAETQRLLRVTEESLERGIEVMLAGNRVHDISSAVQVHVEGAGFSVVRDLCGHGVGKELHEEPSVPNFGKKGTGAALVDGMTLAIEPMVNAGGWQVRVLDDGWTVVTKDGKPSAHFEHTVALVNGRPEILTL